MASPTPRITPLTPDELSDALKQRLGGFTEMSYVPVMLRNPRLFKTFTPFLGAAVPDSSLPARDA